MSEIINNIKLKNKILKVRNKLKKLTLTIMAMLVLGMFTFANAADTKVNGRLYADWNLDMSDGAESANSFNVNRAYVTVKSKLSEFTSVRMTTDIRSTAGFDGYSIILKYGYIDWKPSFGNKNLKVRFGLQPTLYIDNMNKLWSRRYLEKTVGDKNKFLTTSDLGLSAFVNLGEKGKTGYAALQILNGTKYSDVEELNKNKDYSLFTLLKPFANNDELKRSKVLAQFYSGTQNISTIATVDTSVSGTDTTIVNFANDASQFKNQIISIGGMLGYKKTLDVGIDANFKTTGQGYNDTSGVELADVKSSGLSFFGTLYFSDMTDAKSFGNTLNLFSRFDILDPNTDIADDGKSLCIVGIECTPTKGFKASLNIRSTSFEDDSESESSLYLNTLFKF